MMPAPDEWIRRLGTLPLMRQPGEAWMYNTGSDVLGVLIARAAGQSLETFLRERIFEPLGMRDTGFSVPSGTLGRFATSYSGAGAGSSVGVFDPAAGSQWSRPPAFPSGATGWSRRSTTSWPLVRCCLTRARMAASACCRGLQSKQ
jgi:CubicO group peptidase (beta-lactamase class C family)